MAGKDGTKLFDKYHSWVNIDFIMEKCLIGYLKTETEETGDPKPCEKDQKNRHASAPLAFPLPCPWTLQSCCSSPASSSARGKAVLHEEGDEAGD